MPAARLNKFALLAGLADMPYRPPEVKPTREEWMRAARPVVVTVDVGLGYEKLATIELKPEVTAAGECRWVGKCRVQVELGEARPVVDGYVELVMKGSKTWEEGRGPGEAASPP